MSTIQKKHITLDRFLVQRQQGHPAASGELTRVLNQIGVVAKIISDIRPEDIHQRVPFAVGSRQEIQKYETAHGRQDLSG